MDQLAPAYGILIICGECGVLVRGMGFVCLGLGFGFVGFCCPSSFGWVLGASIGLARFELDWRCASWSRAASLVRGGGLEAQGRPARVRCCGLRLVCVFVGLGLLGCLSLCGFASDRKKKF